MKIRHIILIGVSYILAAKCCQVLHMTSEILGSATLRQIPLDNDDELDVLSVGKGRASYYMYDDRLQKSYYLYHVISPMTSSGNWVFNDEFGVAGVAISYRYSWAVAPHLIDNVNDDENYWVVPSDDGTWRTDPTMGFTCADEDDKNSVIYFESSTIQPTLTGFYVERTLRDDNPENRGKDLPVAIYSHIPQHESIEPAFLFKLHDLWIIGENYKVDSGFAYIEASSKFLSDIKSTEWNFLSRDDGQWSIGTAYVYHSTIINENGPREFPSVYEAVRYMHSLKFVPKNQDFTLLRNGVPIPVMGLGTGGIWHENAHQIFEHAIRVGYRFFDLAREYGNEHVLPEVFERSQGTLAASRNDLFIQSKVWPTDLGYHPTMDALLISLDLLRTNYIDAYLLHWPRCDPSISWMHCETTIDPEGTWQGSWRALEKAYSEGLINSIGVSNFDANLLRELSEFAIVKPHIVQNFADPSNMDMDVRKFCNANRIIYQPYASGRNIRFLPANIQATLNNLASKYGVTPYAVVLRYFIQTKNIAVIPRTNNADHLEINMNAYQWSLSTEDMEALGWGSDTKNEL